MDVLVGREMPTGFWSQLEREAQTMFPWIVRDLLLVFARWHLLGRFIVLLIPGALIPRLEIVGGPCPIFQALFVGALISRVHVAQGRNPLGKASAFSHQSVRGGQ
jgi:hypothetical protein